jgi:hypothetical protein
MLAIKNNWKRSPYFHFHPMHNLYSLAMVLVFLGLLMFLMAIPAK